MEHLSNDVYDFASFEAFLFRRYHQSNDQFDMRKASPFGANRSLGIFFLNSLLFAALGLSYSQIPVF
jgi:hypothetical protein